MNYSVAEAFLVLASPSFASPLGKRELRRGEDANHLHSRTDLLFVFITMDAKFGLVKAPYQTMSLTCQLRSFVGTAIKQRWPFFKLSFE